MTAFLFPGQGSQAPGMGRFLFDNFDTAKRTFEEASDALSQDMKKLCFEASAETLALTENTQPALLTVSTVTSRVLTHDIGLRPQITAGHSIGEYASFVLGDVLKFSDAIKGVKLRGQAMQSAVPVGQGGMTATLGLTEEQVEFLCRWTVEQSGFKPLSPANYNSDGQIVISGSLKALDWLKTNFKADVLPGDAKRAKLIPLQVSAPFHCEMMKPAQEKMKAYLESVEMKNSSLPIIQNFHAQTETQFEVLRSNLIQQVSGPVRWTQSMKNLKSQGGVTCIEVGHGAILKGLLKKIDAEYFKVFTTSSLEDLKLLETLTQ